jgi:uncharacterized protein (TIGR03437 family)
MGGGELHLRELRHSLWPLLIVFMLLPVVAGFGQTPQSIKIIAVAQSADFQSGIADPGSLSSIFVTGLEGEQGVITAPTYPVSSELNGVSVFIDSYPAPILALAFFEGYQQINVQVPWEDLNPRVVEVAQNGIQAQTSDTTGALWSVFFSDANGYGVIQHASDYSPVTPQNPAHPGEYIIAYAQNLGPVTSQPATGAPAPFSPLAESFIGAPRLPGCDRFVDVQIGPAQAYPSYIGLTPGTVGVYQVNLQVPTTMQAGDAEISLQLQEEGSVVGCPFHSVTSRSVLVSVQ